MFSDSAIVFWGSACLIWDSALRAWHSHLSWAAKPEQVATSWLARGNSFPVLPLPFRFSMTFCPGRSVEMPPGPGTEQTAPCNEQQLRALLVHLRQFSDHFPSAKTGTASVWFDPNIPGMWPWNWDIHLELCSVLCWLPWVGFATTNGLHAVTFLTGKGPWHSHPHSWEPEQELLHWVKHWLKQQFMWWAEHRGGKLHFKLWKWPQDSGKSLFVKFKH